MRWAGGGRILSSDVAVISLTILQMLIGIFILALLCIFFVVILMTWAWAQDQDDRDISLSEILSTAAIEWGSYILLLAGSIRSLKIHHEAPPIESEIKDLHMAGAARQIPIILVPSLHSGASIFRSLKWRLKAKFYSSIWPFSFRPFLYRSSLLEDDLQQFITTCLKKTRSKYFRLISFGSSRPIVSRVLNSSRTGGHCLQWVCISGAALPSKTQRLLSTPRFRSVYHTAPYTERPPDLLIAGTHDVICYPETIWGDTKAKLSVTPVGHYAVLMHSKTLHAILDQFGDAEL